MENNFSSVEQRIIKFLTQKVKPAQIASCVGLPIEAVISLAGRQDVAEIVTKAHTEHIESANSRDALYDELELEAAKYMKRALPMLLAKPSELIKVITGLNSLKRRGSIAGEDSATGSGAVVQLNLPNILIQNFQVNIDNQVIRAGEQDLTTLPSSQMEVLAKEKENDRIESTKLRIRRDRETSQEDL
jgi:hypothetical protein